MNQIQYVTTVQWQSIESAPKDGTHIMLYYGGYQCPMRVGHWAGWGGGIWRCSSTGYNILSSDPTHWMPLPPGPV